MVSCLHHARGSGQVHVRYDMREATGYSASSKSLCCVIRSLVSLWFTGHAVNIESSTFRIKLCFLFCLVQMFTKTLWLSEPRQLYLNKTDFFQKRQSQFLLRAKFLLSESANPFARSKSFPKLFSYFCANSVWKAIVLLTSLNHSFWKQHLVPHFNMAAEDPASHCYYCISNNRLILLGRNHW